MELDCLDDEQLLKLRLCDLPIKIENTWLEECINKLYCELHAKNISFKPQCYLADEWLTPDREPVIGIPFYLAHPALMRLEKKMMLEVEGGTKASCMRLLRHETGHAINYAYNIYRKRVWQKQFGLMSEEYSDTYRFQPYSKKYVHHLEDYYAQCHPDEDFAETFAVWLDPDSHWEEAYKGWQALKKLYCIDTLMKSISNSNLAIRPGTRHWEVRKMKSTLASFYKRKRKYHENDFPTYFDEHLLHLFDLRENTRYAQEKRQKNIPFAHAFIRKKKGAITKAISYYTKEKKYYIDDIIRKLTERARTLDLVVEENEEEIVIKLASYITMLIMNNLYTGKFGTV